MLGKKLLVTAAAGMLIATTGTAGAAANFDADVVSSIDKGLAWFDAQGCYSGLTNCGDATGLALLALLEKRPSANEAPQGYDGAGTADQARMRTTIGYIINQVNAQGTDFAAYRDGSYMMALSVYMRSGGPEIAGAPLTLKQTLDRVFDRVRANQSTGTADGPLPYPENDGYWCYTGPDCRDSSTTQFVVAGLAAARGVYNSDTYSDTARGVHLDAMAKLARNAYRSNGVAGDQKSWYEQYPGYTAEGCGVLPGEKGHGYNADNANSIQQTASGLWIQLVGGSGLNWPDTQAYLRWLRNRYTYETISINGFDGGWGNISYRYYLWSSYKAYQFLIDGGYTADPGNLGVADVGKLPAASAPACVGRQVHRDPDALPRVALFGPEGAGYYGDEEPRIYFDYAYSLLSQQGASGQFSGSVGTGWDEYADQAYALLVLQRSVGGGCVDIDRDGICDANEEVPPVEPPVEPTGGLYCDKNNNGSIDESDLRALMLLVKGKGLAGVPVSPTNAWANYRNAGVEGGRINLYDYEDCEKVWMRPARLPKKYF